jgi:general secretion pathway protein J
MRMATARGFTLLEMTAVLMLTALISVVIIEALRFGGRAHARVVKVDTASWDIFRTQRFLREAIESTYPFEPDRAAGKAYGLQGTADRLQFSAPARSGVGGLNRYEVLITADSEGSERRNLVVRWHVDRHDDASAGLNEEVLLEDVARVQWSYAVGACAAPLEWQHTWMGRRELPALVRARLTFPADDSRQWPELIVAPRITDDVLSWIYRPVDADSVCGERA